MDITGINLSVIHASHIETNVIFTGLINFCTGHRNEDEGSTHDIYENNTNGYTYIVFFIGGFRFLPPIRLFLFRSLLFSSVMDALLVLSLSRFNSLYPTTWESATRIKHLVRMR
jgi:hypothetical protein